jgi:hypothetical protein
MFLCTLLCVFIAIAADTGRMVTIRAVVGMAEAVSPDSSVVKTLRTGMHIIYGWNIRTFQESRVDILFESGALLKIGENSIVTLSEIVKTGNCETALPVKRKDTL